MTFSFLVGQLPSRTCSKPVQYLGGQARKLAQSYHQFSSMQPRSFLKLMATKASKKNASLTRKYYEPARIPFIGKRHIETLAFRPSNTRRRWLGGGVIVLLTFIGAVFMPPRKDDGNVFDPPRFTPFTVIKREVVSPTSVILTVQRFATGTEDPYKETWERGIWSVEVKQPELQIARSYTPLPPIRPVGHSELRFLIRKEHNGEVSGYLHNLRSGSQIELRGPHPGFDIPENVAEVVFLAGGTGIAPALQAAYSTLERTNTEARVRIVWSNRRREDCEGGGHMDKMGWDAGKKTGLVVEELEALQKKHPGQLTVDYFVDEENTFLNRKTISQLTNQPERGNMEGRKLLFVSGPEGFVNHFAGPKRWEGGKEVQGEVGGVLGKIRLPDWTVWKL